MSGPKVVRIVTREEAIATCERDLQRLDKALARWENQASRLAQLSDAERAAAHARRASLHALLEQERWLDVQLQVKIESEFSSATSPNAKSAPFARPRKRASNTAASRKTPAPCSRPSTPGPMPPARHSGKPCKRWPTAPSATTRKPCSPKASPPSPAPPSKNASAQPSTNSPSA